MVAIGVILLIAAVVGAAVLVGQNRGGTPVQVHAVNHTWVLDPYWILAAGACLALIAVVGIAAVRTGAAHTARLRRERNQLLAENDRLYGRPTGLSTFFGDQDEDGAASDDGYPATRRRLFPGEDAPGR